MPATSPDARTTTAAKQANTTRRKSAPRTPPTTGSGPAATRPAARPGRSGRRPRRTEVVHVPLGSLTQRDQRPHAACRCCGSGHVTRLSMNLTDGTPVDFTSCHHCEHRTWENAGGEISMDGVLDRTRKVTAPQS